MIITDHFKEGGQCFSSHDKDSWICRRSVAPVINCNKKMSRKSLLMLKNHRCAEETPSNELSISAQKRGQNNKKGSQKLKVMYLSNPIIKFLYFPPRRPRPENWLSLKVCCSLFFSSSRSRLPLGWKCTSSSFVAIDQIKLDSNSICFFVLEVLKKKIETMLKNSLLSEPALLSWMHRNL